ncbi:dihydrofolate reductase family protein [Rhizobium sp. NZLR3b]|uniref:dihydrofolate reductase family protein n=1 Tax=Rhizobium sp. NZLR3b TaxID=2731101 RepID=UPI002180B675|nr:dihydrofolate reductase family protein [Rhizobium sp. NZLR3b]
MSISVDGFISDLDGRNTWMFGFDREAKAWSIEFIGNAGLHIMGSRSFLSMAPFWPTSTLAFAPPMNQIPKAVFSRQGPAILTMSRRRSMTSAPRGPDSLRNCSPAQAVGRRPMWRAVSSRRKSPS